jgi:hypothetical protein
MRGECGGIETHGNHLPLRGQFDQRLTEEIVHDSVAGVVQVVAFVADAIHADAATQILDRARREQRMPARLADGRRT